MFEKEESLLLAINLLKMDHILENFNCSLSEKTPIKGHLYLNDHCIGFLSEDKEKTISLNFNEIKDIVLSGENIGIETKDENKFNFFSFDDFNFVFNKINSFYHLFNETEKKDEKNNGYSSDSVEFNNDTDETNKRSPSPKHSLNSSISNDTKSSSCKEVCILKEVNDSKPFNENQSSNCIKKLILDPEKDNKAFIRNNSSKDFIVNKSIDSFESKESLENIKNQEKIKFKKINPDVDHEICQKIINLPPKEFFEKYQTHVHPETSYASFYKWVGEYSEINVQNWEKVEKKGKNDIDKFQRKETFCLALHGVPLINKSHVEKTATYWIDHDGTYHMETLSKSTGVPLSDKFTVETGSEFHPYMNNTKTVFRTYVRTNIIKWTVFKSTLISQGKKTYTQEIERWFKFIGEKGDKIDGDYCI